MSFADQARPESRHRWRAHWKTQPSRPLEAARGMAALRHSAGLDVLVEALSTITTCASEHSGLWRSFGDVKARPAIRSSVRQVVSRCLEATPAAGALARLGSPEGGKHLLARTRKRWTADRALAVELCGEVKVQREPSIGWWIAARTE